MDESGDDVTSESSARGAPVEVEKTENKQEEQPQSVAFHRY
jgi:hypothetical protein